MAWNPPHEGRNTQRGHGRANIDSSRRVTAPDGFNGGNGERSFGSSSGGRESLMTPRNSYKTFQLEEWGCNEVLASRVKKTPNTKPQWLGRGGWWLWEAGHKGRVAAPGAPGAGACVSPLSPPLRPGPARRGPARPPRSPAQARCLSPPAAPPHHGSASPAGVSPSGRARRPPRSQQRQPQAGPAAAAGHRSPAPVQAPAPPLGAAGGAGGRRPLRGNGGSGGKKWRAGAARPLSSPLRRHSAPVRSVGAVTEGAGRTGTCPGGDGERSWAAFCATPASAGGPGAPQTVEGGGGGASVSGHHRRWGATEQHRNRRFSEEKGARFLKTALGSLEVRRLFLGRIRPRASPTERVGGRGKNAPTYCLKSWIFINKIHPGFIFSNAKVLSVRFPFPYTEIQDLGFPKGKDMATRKIPEELPCRDTSSVSKQ